MGSDPESMTCRICSKYLQKNVFLRRRGRRAHLQTKKHIEAVKALNPASEDTAPGTAASDNLLQTSIPPNSERTYPASLSIAERFQISDSEDDGIHVEQLPGPFDNLSFGRDHILDQSGEELLFSAGKGAQDATDTHLLQQMRNIEYYEAAGHFGRVKFASKSTIIKDDDIDEYGDLTITGIVASMRAMGEHHRQSMDVD